MGGADGNGGRHKAALKNIVTPGLTRGRYRRGVRWPAARDQVRRDDGALPAQPRQRLLLPGNQRGHPRLYRRHGIDRPALIRLFDENPVEFG